MDEILFYISQDNPTAAEKTLSTLKEKFALLANNPGIGPGKGELFPSLQGFPVGKFIIFYRRLSGGIEIVRILHGARDIDSLFD